MKEFDSIEKLKKFDWSDDVKLIGINDCVIRLRHNTTIILNNSSPIFSVYGSLSPTVEANGSSSPRVVANDNSSPRVEANDNSSPRVEATDNSSPRVEANGNSSPTVEANDNSSPTVVANDRSSPTVMAYGRSSSIVVANDNSSPTVEANDNSSPTVEANGNSSPRVVAYSSSSPTVEAYGSSSPTVVAYDNSRVIHNGHKVHVKCFANSLFITRSKEYTSDQHIIIQPDKKYGFFERYGIAQSDTYILYKKVSCEFKTQENTDNETLWLVGSTVTHKNWNPEQRECGEGKFHAVIRPLFSDRFRSEKGDRYIAIQIKAEDLYEWEDNPEYPYKIGFREGIVLYECDVNYPRINAGEFSLISSSLALR